MKSYLNRFLLLLIMTVGLIAFMTVIHQPLVLRLHFKDVNRYINGDTDTSVPKETSMTLNTKDTERMITKARHATTTVEPTRKATTVTTTKVRHATTKVEPTTVEPTRKVTTVTTTKSRHATTTVEPGTRKVSTIPTTTVEPTIRKATTIKPNEKNNSITVTYKEITFINTASWYWNSLSPETVFLNCEIKTCRINNGWDHFNNSDAVVFYGVDLPLKSPPMRVKSDQIWVVSGWESPHHTRSQVLSNPEWREQINWTMTYRLDSDIPVPYSYTIVKKIENKANKNYGEIMTNKKKLVAWVVSNCQTNSQRMKYVEQLKEIVPVDVFGRCGSPTPKDLFGMINKTYKFYLSFENSLCKDYITEKFFDRQNLDVVVITRGGGDYTQFYPQESFIDSKNFKNAHELGKFLLKLDKDNNAYLKYLKSKENYRSVDFSLSIKKGLCDMCKMLHDKKIHRNVYKDYNKWWSNNHCNSKPTDIIL
ncbi:alpha-(1,3)-fucosyltransferase C [Patella vulgata]|uniref:alpha-(1,3)-fucosyltransferase C n=1 Tax=Patella vulgata TaxID=6465 RepID=UPI00217F5E2C|nr:alpha-(1,3)-fucosyltransferase C [Patella vulgata]